MSQVAVIIAFFASLHAHAAYESMNFPLKKIENVVLVNGSGKISIYSSDIKEIVVEYEKIRFQENCEFLVSKQLKELTLTIDENRSGDNDQSCVVNFRIRVPETMNFELKNGFGPLDVLGLKSNIKYAVGNGEVQLDGIFKSIDGRLGTGKTTIRGFSKRTNIKSGKGNIKFVSSEPLSNGEFVLNNGMGDLVLDIPEDSQFKVNFESGIGQLRSEIEESLNKKYFKISMKSGTGGLRIRKK